MSDFDADEKILIDAFAGYLKRRRTDAGISQEALAEKAGITRSFIAKLENRTTRVSVSYLDKIANALGCTPPEFLYGVYKQKALIERSTAPAPLPSDPEIDALRSLLEDMAKEEKVISYQDLSSQYGLPAKWTMKHRLASMVTQITEQDIADNRPLLCSVIVKSKKPLEKSVPGKGYFKLLCKYRDIPIPTKLGEKQVVHQKELDRLRAAIKAK